MRVSGTPPWRSRPPSRPRSRGRTVKAARSRRRRSAPRRRDRVPAPRTSARAAGSIGSASASIDAPTPLASAIRRTPSARPSLRSMHADRRAVARRAAARGARAARGRDNAPCTQAQSEHRVVRPSSSDVASVPPQGRSSLAASQPGRRRADRPADVDLVARAARRRASAPAAA